MYGLLILRYEQDKLFCKGCNMLVRAELYRRCLRHDKVNAFESDNFL